jgi:hypothetical protein
LREAIIFEADNNGLGGHFRRDKTFVIQDVLLFLSKIGRDVTRFIQLCRTCHITKSHGHNSGLYIPLLVAKSSWDEVSIDFVLGLREV